jgi:hypothetical protein
MAGFGRGMLWVAVGAGGVLLFNWASSDESAHNVPESSSFTRTDSRPHGYQTQPKFRPGASADPPTGQSAGPISGREDMSRFPEYQGTYEIRRSPDVNSGANAYRNRSEGALTNGGWSVAR